MTFTRELLASAPHNVIAARITADKPGSITFKATFESPQRATSRSEGMDALSITGVSGESGGVRGAVKFKAIVRASATGGTISVGPDFLEVTGADSVTLTIAIGTSYKSWSDVSGDPAARVSATLDATIPFDRLRF